MSFKASAPGSLMLLGEYAVLHGGYAVSCAVNYRMFVTLTARSDNKIKIHSALGEYETELSDLEIISPFQFILAVLKKFQNELRSGCDIFIESEFSDQLGLGSSAAVTVALIKAISQWISFSFTQEELILDAREIIRSVQGIGSGADVAASVLGGIVAYSAKNFFAEKFIYDYPLSVVYSGSKTKTVDAISFVKNKFLTDEKKLKNILDAINGCAEKGIRALEENNFFEFGNSMNQQQLHMEELGVSTAVLHDVVQLLKNKPSLHGVKISGSGLGDCAVALGELRSIEIGTLIPCQIDLHGVRDEKN